MIVLPFYTSIDRPYMQTDAAAIGDYGIPFLFPGTDVTGAMDTCQAVVSLDVAGSAFQLQIVDATNAQMVLDFTSATIDNAAWNIHDLGAVANLSAGPALWLLKAAKTTDQPASIVCIACASMWLAPT